MSYAATVFKVMIASPGDVQEERDIFRNVIHKWNAVHSFKEKLVLLPVGWETHTTPEMGEHPQEIINKQMVRACDMLVCVFGPRIGSRTEKAPSGTVEEFNEFMVSGKPIMPYFSNQSPPNLGSIDVEQLKAVRAFKESIKLKGLYHEYNDCEQFRAMLVDHLAQKVISDLLPLCPEQEALEEQLSENISLSEDAKILLKVTADFQKGEILRLHTSGGTTVQAGNHVFCDGSNHRAAARWESALKELNDVDCINDRKGKGKVFRVTNQGYQVSDKISGNLSWSD